MQLGAVHLAPELTEVAFDPSRSYSVKWEVDGSPAILRSSDERPNPIILLPSLPASIPVFVLRGYENAVPQSSVPVDMPITPQSNMPAALSGASGKSSRISVISSNTAERCLEASTSSFTQESRVKTKGRKSLRALYWSSAESPSKHGGTSVGKRQPLSADWQCGHY